MQRVTEPELMTDPAQVQAYAEADFSSTEKNVIDSLKKLVKNHKIQINQETLIIDLGCGPGNISEKIALCWPNANVLGIDDSEEMLNVARKRQENSKNIADLQGLSYAKMNLSLLAMHSSKMRKRADIVVSNSFLHHIHDPSIFFKAILNISKRGALNFHRDLRRPNSLEEISFIQNKHLYNADPILTRDFNASLKAAFTIQEVENEINLAGIKNFKITEVEDRYIDLKVIIS